MPVSPVVPFAHGAESYTGTLQCVRDPTPGEVPPSGSYFSLKTRSRPLAAS
jgi:hypothetical protein